MGRSRENQTFSQQQATSFAGIQNTANTMNGFYQTLEGYFGERFGRQSRTFDTLSRSLDPVLGRGPGQYSFTGKQPAVPGAPGAGGAGSAGGGGRRGEGEAGGMGGNTKLLPQYGYGQEQTQLGWYGFNEGDYDVDFQTGARFWGAEEEALRADAAEQVTGAYGDAGTALGQRLLQLGVNSPGLASAAVADLLAEQAAAEEAAQREVTMFGAENLRDDLRLQDELNTRLAMARGQGRLTAGGSRAQQLLGAHGLQVQDEASRRAAGAARAAARMQVSESARQFNEMMKFRSAELQSENFFRGVGAYGQMAGLQDPLGYGQLGLGTLGNMGNLWSTPYNTGSSGMVQTRGGGWQSILGSVLGGALGIGFGPGGFIRNALTSQKG